MLHRTAVHPATLELLKTIMKKLALFGFCLAGGTSLALQIGHRVARSLVYFEDADEDEEVILLEEKIRWESVKKLIREEVRKKYR